MGASEVPTLVPRIVSEYERDGYAWTEGLQWYGGYLYESTGLVQSNPSISSSLQQIKLEDGKATVEARLSLPAKYWGEGLARAGDKLYQLCLGQAAVFEYGLQPLTQSKKLKHITKGIKQRWGLCFDPVQGCFYLSNGSGTIRQYKHLTNLLEDKSAHTITVICNGHPVYYLNDLEFASGSIYAAVWVDERLKSVTIVQINPQTGNVEARIDASNLRNHQNSPDTHDLNGIAYYYTDTDGQDVFLVTGKLWSKIFAVKFFPK